MSNNYGFNKYKQTSVTTASRGQVLLMLYESAIKHTKVAIEAVNAKQLARKGESILKIQDIINELALTLNHDVGGNISKDLERLYNYMIEQITTANIKNEAKPLEIVLKLLETLYEGWKGAVSNIAKMGGDPALAAAMEKNSGIDVNKTPSAVDTATKNLQPGKSVATGPAITGPAITGGFGMLGAIQPAVKKTGGK